MANEMELVLYKTENGDITINVGIENETVWLNQGQMVVLFQRNQSVISRHINNLFSEGEVDMESNMHFLHNANSDKPIA